MHPYAAAILIETLFLFSGSDVHFSVTHGSRVRRKIACESEISEGGERDRSPNSHDHAGFLKRSLCARGWPLRIH